MALYFKNPAVLVMSSVSSKRGGAPRRPNAVLYALAVFFCGLYMRLVYRLRLDRSGIKGLRGPVIVLGNHASNLDFITMACALYPLRLNFMVTTYFFRHFLLGRLLRFMGCIPKRQFVPDTGSVRACLAAAKQGQNIGIFPEGQVTYTGATGRIEPSIGKLVKKLGLTVVICKVHGNHLSCPKWARGKTFRGVMQASASILYTPQQLSSLTAQEIFEGLREALDYNEYEWQRKEKVHFRPRRTADGLQSILYRCPACGADPAMQPDGEKLVCEHCGYAVALDEYGLLRPVSGGRLYYDNPVSWFCWEYAEARKEAEAGAFPYSRPCRLYKTVDGRFGYTLCGSGVMTADWRGLHFEGEKEGEPFAFSALIEHQSNLTHNMGIGGIDILVGENSNYALAPQDLRSMMKFISFYLIARDHSEEQAPGRPQR